MPFVDVFGSLAYRCLWFEGIVDVFGSWLTGV